MGSPTFSPAPREHPSLAADEVHVWRIALLHEGAADEGLLDAGELVRARRFQFERHRRRFVVLHAALRRLLAGYMGEAPKGLRFERGERGKPSLRGEPELQYNLSDSGELGLLAVSRSGPVGVDVELPRRVASLEAIARRFFAPQELQALLEYAPDQRPLAFRRIWTRKEAYLKALGEGIAGGLAGFVVSADADARLLSVADPEQARRGWRLFGLDPGGQADAALVAVEEVREVRCFEHASAASPKAQPPPDAGGRAGAP